MEKLNHVFWNEIAPGDHLLQLYENEEIFLDAVEAFVSSGFVYGDSVIVIATEEHLRFLGERLNGNFSLIKYVASKHFIPLDADMVLDQITAGGIIDEKRFDDFVNDLLDSLNINYGSTVRVFCELVSLLCGIGNNDAAVKMEKLWHKYCDSDNISLFCAYPQKLVKSDSNEFVSEVCSCHTKILNENLLSNEINLFGSYLRAGTFIR